MQGVLIGHLVSTLSFTLMLCACEPEELADDPSFLSTSAPGDKPLLGWSSWSVQSSTRPGYGKGWLNETNVKNASDAMQQKLQAAGYRYINIDAGWNADLSWNFSFDQNGIPKPNPTRFPGGIAGIAEYVHGNGQKLGLYFTVGLEKKVYQGNYPILGTSCRTRDIAKRPLSTVPNTWNAQYEIELRGASTCSRSTAPPRSTAQTSPPGARPWRRPGGPSG